jgi:hypothetical protein
MGEEYGLPSRKGRQGGGREECHARCTQDGAGFSGKAPAPDRKLQPTTPTGRRFQASIDARKKIFAPTGEIAQVLRTARHDGISPQQRSFDMIRATRLLPALLLALALPAAATDRAVFSDDFSTDTSGWVNTQSADYEARGIALYDGSGGYQLTPVQDGTFGIIPAPRQSAGGDVRIDAALFLTTGIGRGTAGVVCRQRDNDNFYAFMVSGDHLAAIVKVAQGQATTLARGNFEGLMPNIADVRLGARCEGDGLQLSIDGDVVAEANDADFDSGRTGLIVVGEKMAGTSAVFDDFALFQIAH